MTDDASNLVAFLIARIEEDERIADHVASVSPTSDTRFCLWATQFAFDADRVIVAADYQRVIADCAAKRASSTTSAPHGVELPKSSTLCCDNSHRPIKIIPTTAKNGASDECGRGWPEDAGGDVT